MKVRLQPQVPKLHRFEQFTVSALCVHCSSHTNICTFGRRLLAPGFINLHHVAAELRCVDPRLAATAVFNVLEAQSLLHNIKHVMLTLHTPRVPDFFNASLFPEKTFLPFLDMCRPVYAEGYSELTLGTLNLSYAHHRINI